MGARGGATAPTDLGKKLCIYVYMFKKTNIYFLCHLLKNG